MTGFENKKILIVGLGKSGIAAFDALISLGARPDVQDSRDAASFEKNLLGMLNECGAACYFGRVPPAEERFDMLVLSPGVSPELDFIKRARQNGSEVIGELELAFRIAKGKFVAITGTNGKTTTTALVGEIFKNAERDTYVVGNIGVAVTSVAGKAAESSWLVTEVSSFQLETAHGLHPVISAVLNITPDHMDRHKDIRSYAAAKAGIFKNQTENDYFIVNFDDSEAYALSKSCGAKVVPFSRKHELKFGAFVKDGVIVIRDESGGLTELCGADELAIPGTHNLENALAAAAVSYFAGIPADVIKGTLKSFGGVEHRLEFCGEIGGVRFVNDSKGTNPDASVKAVEAINGGIVLIAGGYDKNSDFDGFIDAFGGKVRHMVLLGKTAPKIKETAESKGFNNSTILDNMEQCVNMAFELARPGNTVLLSPACASWDMYSDFEERGRHFKRCVKRLGESD